MADELRIDARLSIPLAEIELRTSRSSGPGGQHANVTASRVEAVFDVEASRRSTRRSGRGCWSGPAPVVTAVAQDARGQSRNRELALQRLAAKIAAALRVPRRRRADAADPGLAPAPAGAEAAHGRAQARPPPAAADEEGAMSLGAPRSNG